MYILTRAHIHGIIMSTCVLVLLPLFALTVYLPWPKRIPLIHAPLQLVTLCLLVVGFALGVNVARDLALTTAYHPIIGEVVVAIIVLLQPAMGLMQHLRYSRTGERGVFGLIHQWTGRLVILLGVINGGCGLKLARSTSGWPIVAYPLIAAVTASFYIGVVVVVVSRRRLRGERDCPD
jgi:hypothetical protein